jgi:hypothetical protein
MQLEKVETGIPDALGKGKSHLLSMHVGEQGTGVWSCFKLEVALLALNLSIRLEIHIWESKRQ